MPPSGILRRMALVTAEVSEERSASIIRVKRSVALGTTLAVTINRRFNLFTLFPYLFL
jgi:hypothetical protein